MNLQWNYTMPKRSTKEEDYFGHTQKSKRDLENENKRRKDIGVRASPKRIKNIKKCIRKFDTTTEFCKHGKMVSMLHCEGYGVRLTGIHILTNLKVLDALLVLLRQVMSEKIGGRIRVHHSLESLYEFAPKEVLPIEYGEDGESRTVNELKERWFDILSSEKFRQYYREMNAACTDERFRQTDKFNEQYMGMPGTFRTLSVD